MSKNTLILYLLLVFGLLFGAINCGQKGDLVLPDTDNEKKPQQRILR